MRAFGVVRAVPLDISMCITRENKPKSLRESLWPFLFYQPPRLSSFDGRNMENNIAFRSSFDSRRPNIKGG